MDVEWGGENTGVTRDRERQTDRDRLQRDRETDRQTDRDCVCHSQS